MLSVYDDFRTITYVYEYTKTSYRLCSFSYLYSASERFASILYYVSDDRYCYAEYPRFAFSERNSYLFVVSSSQYTTRFCEAVSSGLSDERTCTYPISITISLGETKLILPIRRYSSRHIFVEGAYTDFRHCYVPIPIHNERKALYEIERKTELFDTELNVPYTRISDIGVYVEYAYTDFRYVWYEELEKVSTQRHVYLSVYRHYEVHDTQLNAPFEGDTERICITLSSIAFSERISILNDFSSNIGCFTSSFERHESSRRCVYVPHLTAIVFDTYTINAIPEVDERQCVFDAFVFNSELKCFVETRDRYVVRKYASGYPNVFGVSLDHNLMTRRIYSFDTVDVILVYSGQMSFHTQVDEKLFVSIPTTSSPIDILIFTDRGEILTRSVSKSQKLEKAFTMKAILNIKKN